MSEPSPSRADHPDVDGGERARRPRSGAQYALAGHGYSAVVASVGASLRELRHGDRELVLPFDADEVRPQWRGVTLAPWPNRVVDGRYTFEGATHRLPLTEPERGHALHGLVPWLDFAAVERAERRLVLEAVVEPQAGYPFRVLVRTVFELTPGGLRQTVAATNLGDAPAPFGTGPHPYLVAGDGPVDGWELSLPASAVLETDERAVPTALRDVDDDPERFDFREPRPIGDARIDHAFTALDRDPAGRSRVEVRAADGAGVAITFDGACPWVQVFTSDRPGEPGHRGSLAVEPMTCPPDAFNSGTDLVVLPPGGSTSASWTIGAVAPLG